MRKVILTIGISIFFIMCFSFAAQESADVMASSGGSSAKSSQIKFEYFYRGFATLKEDKASTYPQGALIIESDKDWHDFMDKYVPGIFYAVPVDFSKECLVYYGMFSAKPTYSQAENINELVIKKNSLEITSKPAAIYAENTDGIVHCFVNIVKVNKKYIPSNIENVYHALSIKYDNSKYGFCFYLPSSWKGYSIINGKWEGLAFDEKQGEKITQTGPMITIRHPTWTAKQPRQDIPIMVFTSDQWSSLQKDEFHIGAAPVGPTKLGSNSKYVFALPARYNFAFPAGYEEVERILNSNALQPK